MVAETYGENSNLTLASYQLAFLGSDEPLRYVQQAIINAEQLKFPAADIASLASLAGAYQVPSVSPTIIQTPVATVTP